MNRMFNFENDITCPVQSDHFPLYCELKHQLNEVDREPREDVKKYNKPKITELVKYNSYVWRKYHQLLLDPNKKTKKSQTHYPC